MADTPAGEVRRGALTVVGTGIDAASQLTPAARGAIEGADEVVYLVADPVAALRVEVLNPRARSLDHLYGPTKARRETYAEVEDAIVGAVMRGARVCAVLYGHPGVSARPGHRAVAQVRAAGLPARMLPAVSALDCLVADLGLVGDTDARAPSVMSTLCVPGQDWPPVDPDARRALALSGG